MKIHINGEPLNLQQTNNKDLAPNITDALRQYLSPKQQEMSFALALNSDFVNKSQYASTRLNDGDSIDVLFPIHGG
ncbi:MAG: sulfur carrier protein [Psychrosphaera sp.]|jgi:sulfur carrier protein|uniref:sulfur carrier protein ThiS n=1 Tax=Psychrosphaera sp. F3M07 TaxID=2841560 RepID=UPI001C08CC13|nr:sulfur carrier protein ThiS [Psychrosphaera sp. F3M07]MBU2919073.1 sulfur carrier protein ThiS [Psychrosphaera sp. F3M07]